MRKWLRDPRIDRSTGCNVSKALEGRLGHDRGDAGCDVQEGRHAEGSAGRYMDRAQQGLAVADCRGIGRASKAVAGHGTCQGSHLGPTSALTKDRAGDVSCQRLPDTQCPPLLSRPIEGSV